MPSRRQPALDGIRGIAILAVMANHTVGPIGHGGWLGVDVFFVLSGFLITSILLREQDRSGHISLRHFYLRRVLRLYPALLATCVYAVAIAGHQGYPTRDLAWRGAGTAAAYLTDVGIMLHWDDVYGLFLTWSLAIEEHFYLVWPLILVTCLVRGHERWVPWIAAIGLAYSVVAMAILPTVFGVLKYAAFRPDTRGGGLLVGCLLALLLRRRALILPWWAPWLALATMATLMLSMSPDIDATLSLTVGIPLTWIASAIIVADVSVSRTRLFARTLAWPPLAYIGLISYGLYLYHLWVFDAVTKWLSWSRTPESVLSVIGAIAVASLSYFYYERPFLRLKKHYASAGSVDADETRAAQAVPAGAH